MNIFNLHTGVFDALNHFGYRSRFDKSVKLLLINPGNIGGKVIDYFYLPFCFRRFFGRGCVGSTFGFSITFGSCVGFWFFGTLRCRRSESIYNSRCEQSNDERDNDYDCKR